MKLDENYISRGRYSDSHERRMRKRDRVLKVFRFIIGFTAIGYFDYCMVVWYYF